MTRYTERTLEGTLILITLALTCLLYWVQGYKMVVLNLFHLPVVLAAFYLGLYRSGVLALLSVLLASMVAASDLHHFAASTSPLVIGLAITVWAGVIGLNAIFVGTLSDERSRKLLELHDAYMGVVEVLSHYLKSADPTLENRSKRVAALSERIGRQMRLAEKEIDDIRIAALLQDMENIEVTARVIGRAVGDLRRTDAREEHTFHGSDLVQSLGSVLTGALPLILNHTDSRDLEFSDADMRATGTAPFGASIIRTVCEYERLIQGPGDPLSSPEAIRALRSDLDGTHHPAVLHALEQVVLGAEPLRAEEEPSAEFLVSVAD